MAKKRRPKKGTGKKLTDAAGSAADKAGDAAKGVVGKAGGAVGGAAGAVGGAAGSVGDAAKGVVGKAGGAVGGAADTVGGAAKGVVGKAGGAVGGAAGAVGAVGAASAARGAKATARLSGDSRTTVRKAGATTVSTSGRGGGRGAYVAPDAKGRFPWKWRWWPLLPLLAALLIGSWWGWTHEEGDQHERAMANLACAGVDTSAMEFDWHYQEVDVTGTLPEGVTQAQVEDIIDNGAQDTDCVNDRIDDDGYEGGDSGVHNVNTAGLALAPVVAAVADPEPDPTPTAVPPTPTAVPPTPTAVPPTPTPEPEPTATPEPPQLAALAVAASIDGDTIVLTGETATEEQRQAIIAAAESACGDVDESIAVVDGEPTDTSPLRIEELTNLISQACDTAVLSGTATVDDAELKYALLAADEGSADNLAGNLDGSGTIDAPEAPAPEFTG